MSYRDVESSLLNRRLRVSSKTTAKDSIGGLTEAWTVTYDEIKGFINEVSSEQKIEVHGREATKTHTAVIQSEYGGNQIIIQEEDRVFDKNTNTTYRVIRVERVFNADSKIHHHNLWLEAVRESITETQGEYVAAKAYIT